MKRREGGTLEVATRNFNTTMRAAVATEITGKRRGEKSKNGNKKYM